VGLQFADDFVVVIDDATTTRRFAETEGEGDVDAGLNAEPSKLPLVVVARRPQAPLIAYSSDVKVVCHLPPWRTR